MKTKTLFFIVLLVAGTVSSVSAQSYRLKYNHLKGKTYRYNIAVNSNTVIEMGGQENKIKSNSNQLQALTIEKVKKGKATVLSSLEDMEISVKAMGKDTTMKVPQLIGQKNRFTLLPDGELKDIQKLDSAKKNDMMGMFATSMPSFRFRQLPLTLIKPNDSWTFSKTDSTYDPNKNLIENTTKLNFTLEKEELKNGRKCLKINYLGDLAMKGKTMMQGMEMYQDGTGKSKGTFWFDAKAGLLISDESETNIDMTISVVGQEGMTLPTTVIAKQTTTLVE